MATSATTPSSTASADAPSQKGRRAVVVSVLIDRTPAEVWADVRDIATHVDWMHDAVAIRFMSDQREGVGVRFECDTKVGPFELVDVMEVTAWEDEKTMGVRHVGLVEGSGEFTLRPIGGDKTDFRWEEDLTFPLWMGGPIGAFFARPVLKAIWKRNLKNLKARIERR